MKKGEENNVRRGSKDKRRDEDWWRQPDTAMAESGENMVGRLLTKNYRISIEHPPTKHVIVLSIAIVIPYRTA
jgi:hypothetical protein